MFVDTAVINEKTSAGKKKASTNWLSQHDQEQGDNGVSILPYPIYESGL